MRPAKFRTQGLFQDLEQFASAAGVLHLYADTLEWGAFKITQWAGSHLYVLRDARIQCQRAGALVDGHKVKRQCGAARGDVVPSAGLKI